MPDADVVPSGIWEESMLLEAWLAGVCGMESRGGDSKLLMASAASSVWLALLET